MIQLSSKCVYSIHALFELALSYGGPARSIRDIASAREIPEDYLRQLVVGLKKAGLVKSLQGFDGGYTLAKPPSDITIKEIIEAMDGPLKPITIQTEEPALNSYWMSCNDQIKNIFNTTLGNLVGEKRRLDKNVTYQI